MTAGTERRRALGLVLQVVAAVTSVEPIAAVVRRVVLGPSEFDIRDAPIAPVAMCALQFVAGWLLVHRPRLARAAAIALAAGAIAEVAWSLVPDLAAPQANLMESVVEHSSFRALVTAISIAAWPVAAAIGAWLGPRDEGAEVRRRAEAGGVLAAYGVTMLAVAALRIGGVVLMWGRYYRAFDVALEIPDLVDLAIGLLALRAATELVTGMQHGRSRLSIVMWVAAIGYPLAFAGAYLTVGLTRSELTSYFAVSAVVGAAWKVVPVAIVRWHAGPIERTAIAVGAPDPDAAATPLAWLHLWFAVELAVVALEILRHNFDGEATLALLVVVALSIANAVAFTVALRHGAHKRRAAVVAIVLSGLALGVFLVFAIANGVLVPGNPIALTVAMVAVPATLVWLGRPKLRGRRGLGSVFE